MNTIQTKYEKLPESFPMILEHVIKEGAQAGQLTSDFFPRFQNQLWLLMEDLFRKYTSGDSSSLPKQTADSLAQSACFLLGASLHKSLIAEKGPGQIPNSLAPAWESLKSASLSSLWQDGEQIASAITEKSRRLLISVKQTPHPVPSMAYLDTVKELEEFFRQYDHRLMACDIPAMIDYQLAVPVSEELLGVQFINSYLRRLMVENRFCRAFDPGSAQRLLQDCYGPFFREVILSFFEPLFINACGLVMVKKSPEALQLTEEDTRHLQSRFLAAPSEIPTAVSQAVIRLCRELSMTDASSLSYLKECGALLAVGLRKGLEQPESYQGIFTLHKEHTQTVPPALSYEGGEKMADDQLRDLIAQVMDCSLRSDKFRLIRCAVRSLEDLAEVLEASLFEDEPVVFLSAMENVELAALHQLAAERASLSPADLLDEKETAAFPLWVSGLLSLKSRYASYIRGN